MALIPAALVAFGLVAVASFIYLFIWQRAGGKQASPKSSGKAADLSQPKEEPKQRVTLLFGTQTGTAERFSKQLKTELGLKYGDKETAYEVHDVEEYKHEEALPKERLVFLLLATYGDGEPTDNAAAFYTWVTRAAAEVTKGRGTKLLEGVSFGVFGLGNKQYEHFCAVGSRVHDSMVTLGATPVIERGEGDDDEDIEADFDTWRGQLFEKLDASRLLGTAPKLSKLTSNVMELIAADSVASYDVELLGGVFSDSAEPPRWTGDGSGARSPFPAVISMRRELHTPESERSCLHVELDIEGAEAEYEAGDHVGLLAENEADIVERAAAALGLSPSLVFTLHPPPSNPHQLPLPFSGPITLRDALAWHTDLLSPVSRAALQTLAAFADEDTARRLRHLLSPDGMEEYKAWQCQSRSLLEVLEEFSTVRPPLGAFFGSIAGRLQARYYSISSSPKVTPNTVHVTCSVVHHDTPTGRHHRGVTSHQLKRYHAGDIIPAFIRRSTFKLPSDPSAPVIMIGPGTGLAPFRGFLQERAALAAMGEKLGPAHLFFGCRNRKHDYIYEAELADLRDQGGFTQLHTAFSREGPTKVYVQHHIQRHADELWPLIAGGGYVYVCGEAKFMAKDVHKALLGLAERSPLGAEKFVAELAASGRYQKDVW